MSQISEVPGEGRHLWIPGLRAVRYVARCLGPNRAGKKAPRESGEGDDAPTKKHQTV